MNKKILSILLCGLLAGSALASCGKDLEFTSSTDKPASLDSSGDTADTTLAPPENLEIMNYTAPKKGDQIVEMNIKGYGTVKIRLFPEYAEKGVENFVGLAKDGYYDGLTFHRVINSFMIQGGDPTGTGTGGKSLWGSSFDGGTDGHLAHVPGALSYANSTGPASNTSQFFIVTGRDIDEDDWSSYEQFALQQFGHQFTENEKAIFNEVGGVPYLDGGYTIFGQVFDGLDIIFKIQGVATDANDKPLNEDVIVESVKITEYNGEELKWKISDYKDFVDPKNDPVANFTAPEEGDEIVCMEIKDYGTVKIRLFPELLPKASQNFLELARKGYYDGLTFHRVICDFMIQGGDPLGSGMGGESYWGGSFDGGTDRHLIHAAGAVAYANSGSTATNGSQFYIVTGTSFTKEGIELYGFSDSVNEVYLKTGGTPHLDGNYTVFGQVIDGLDIIFEVQTVDTGDNDKPKKDVIIEKMTVEKYDGSEPRWYITDYDEKTETTEGTTEEKTEDTAAAPAE